MNTATELRELTFRALVPVIHVTSVPRSVAFYARLGFRVSNAVALLGPSEAVFASIQSGGARLMLVHGTSIRPEEQGVILTLFCDDVHAAHATLQAAGIGVGEIGYPPERPHGRFRLVDPDGYDLAVTHV